MSPSENAPGTTYASVVCHVTSSASGPRPFTIAYWPQPQIVNQLAVMQRIVASETSPIVSGLKNRVMISVPATPIARPPMLVTIIHSTPRAAR